MEAATLQELVVENQHIGNLLVRTNTWLAAQTTETTNTFTIESVEQRVRDQWARFEENQFNIIRFAEAPQHQYVTEGQFEAGEAQYLTALGRIGLLQQQLEGAARQQHAVEATQFPAPLPAYQVPQGMMPMRLPNIDLPTFSGDILEWESFRDQFISLVHQSAVHTNVQKLLLLQCHLRGDAAELLKNTPITDANYVESWNSLVIRYGNQRILSYMHMKSLLDLPAAANSSASEIKRVMDFIQQTIRSFRSLDKPMDNWNEWFVFFLSSKLDAKTRLDWETSLRASAEIPLLQTLIDFLENRLQALQTISSTESFVTEMQQTEQRNSQSKSRARIAAAVNSKGSSWTTKCSLCSKSHHLSRCGVFANMNFAGKQDVVRSKKLCTNCLGSGHFKAKCPSTGRCRTCSSAHHTLLHRDDTMTRQQEYHRQRNSNASTAKNTAQNGPESENESESTSQLTTQAQVYQRNAHASSSQPSNSVVGVTMVKSTVLLATTIIRVVAHNQKVITVRALLDTGADASFISQSAVQALGLRPERTDVAVLGFSSSVPLQVKHQVEFRIENTVGSFSMRVSALVRPKLNFVVPTTEISAGSWPHIRGIQLADPEFATPSQIELLLGADLWNTIFMDHRIRGPPGTPDAYLTEFGYVLLGPAGPDARPSSVNCAHTLSSSNICKELRRFWEIEEVSTANFVSPDEEFCERHFQQTHSRTANGRYVVKLPLRQPVDHLLDGTRPRALALHAKLEERFKRNPEFEHKYREFMQEYFTLGHMRLVSEEPCRRHPHAYYIPHHGVFKAHDSSGKIRVVFNASAKAPSGHSLNSLLHTGPKLQHDLWIVLLRWRMFRYVYATDCVKFYRQILVHRDDCHLQRIVFRLKKEGEIQDFELCTVTYGTTPAQFLSLRAVDQLVHDEGRNFPRAVKIIQNHKYIDDYLFGDDDQDELELIMQELSQLLQRGGMSLAKWASNLPQRSESQTSRAIMYKDGEGVKALGILWNPESDTLSLQVQLGQQQGDITLRNVLSDSSRIFDVLGKKAPVTIRVKIFIQDIWVSGASWDQKLSGSLLGQWLKLRPELKKLQEDGDERWLHTFKGAKLQVHGFSDASSRAYAAAVFFRTESEKGIFTRLAICKTEVAPIKTLSIPKLELSAALLLANLLDQLTRNLDLDGAEFFAWSDAQVALTWIRSHPSRWKPFVANRVSQIQGLTDVAIWNFVPGDCNPADLATRGLSVQQLRESSL